MTWILKTSLMRLSTWTSSFRYENIKITHAQVWLMMHDFPLEYWKSTTLFAIVYSISTP